MNDIRKLLRPNIAALIPYSSARHEFTGEARVYLDANESPFPSALNRYPDPLQSALKEKIGELYDLDPGQIFCGNGSDEAIDLLIRSFCEPGIDSILTMPPTYGMYRVSADINAVEVTKVPLTASLNIDRTGIEEAIQSSAIKLIFACSPNNPTGSVLGDSDLEWLLSFKDQIVILDEAYADFAPTIPPPSERLKRHSNLIILRTFSKAWGMAGARLGMAFASRTIIEILNTVKPPYNINTMTQDKVLLALRNRTEVHKHIRQIIAERVRCATLLNKMNIVRRVYPSHGNFLLVNFENADAVFQHLIRRQIIIRDRQKDVPGCLRLTIGTREENDQLLTALRSFS